jgi:transcription antitermination factor NusA-like protein
VSVEIMPEENTARVIVPERQLSLAIGKEGQNARLAAKLTGWRIDIRSDAVPLARDDSRPTEVLASDAAEATGEPAAIGAGEQSARPGAADEA